VGGVCELGSSSDFFDVPFLMAASGSIGNISSSFGWEKQQKNSRCNNPQIVLSGFGILVCVV